MLFVQLAELHLRVKFCVGDHLSVQLLVGPSFSDIFVKVLFLMEHGIAIQSHPVANVL